MRFLASWPLLLSLPLLSASTPQGLKITVRNTMLGQSSETTQYFQSDRRRSEYRARNGFQAWPGRRIIQVYGPPLAMIWRCDLAQISELNLDDREYHSSPLPKWPTREELQARAAKSPQPAQPKKPNLLVEISTVDTGERKELFGYTARHVITTRKYIPLEGAVSEPSESVTDGWYIDLDTRLSCEPNLKGAGYALLTGSVNGAARDIPTIKATGKPETGFPVELKTIDHSTFSLPDGTRKENTSTFETQVTELSSAPLDPSLFEIPVGFRRVDHLRREPTPPLSAQLASAWQRFKLQLSRLFN